MRSVPAGEAARERVEAAFRRAAEEAGGTFAVLTWMSRPVVQWSDPDWTITLEYVPAEEGWSTFVRAPFRAPRGSGARRQLVVRDEGLFDDLWKTLGFLQDVEVGDPRFDRRFLVKGFPTTRVRELLDEEVRELLLAQPRMDLRVHGPRGPLQPGPTYPAGVDELWFRERGGIDDVDRLVALLRLFRTLLPRLSPGSATYGRDPAALVERLRAPAGVARAPGQGLVYWDGDVQRREAARRLGDLGAAGGLAAGRPDGGTRGDVVDALTAALGEDDRELVAAAARALGQVGDPAAADALFRLLGRRTGVEEEPGPAAAARALEALGLAGTVGAFEAALQGRPERLRQVAGHHRAGIVAGLMQVVESGELGARPHAARALGVLGAHPALPLLREKSAAMGMRTRLTEAAREAVGAIERQASLPRPAAGAPEQPDTLPRPAGEPRPDGRTLPRPADGTDRPG